MTEFSTPKPLPAARPLDYLPGPRQITARKIMSAKERPPGVSDVRWRIELRRRERINAARADAVRAAFPSGSPPAPPSRPRP